MTSDKHPFPQMQCPECRATGSMDLEFGVGWFCTKCETGPYIQHASGLKLASLGRH